MLKECSKNTVFAFTETWLTSQDDNNLWSIDSNYYSCFRCELISEKSKGGGIMLLIPKIFNPKNRNDFPKMSKDFETLWVEFTLPYKRFPSMLVNVAYNPEKSKTDIFLEELALQIDYGITKKQKILLLGDFNINYLHPNERNKMDTLFAPYGLSVVNKTPTRGKI